MHGISGIRRRGSPPWDVDGGGPLLPPAGPKPLHPHKATKSCCFDCCASLPAEAGATPLPYLPYGDEKKVAGGRKEAEERDRSKGKRGGGQRGEEEREEGKGEKEATVCSFSSPQLPFLYWGGFYGMEN